MARQRKRPQATADKRLYDTLDVPFYRRRIAPLLPREILDFHTHVWKREHWKRLPWNTRAAGGRYMVTEAEYAIEDLEADGRRMFPERPYNAVCFGNPTPQAVLAQSNAYAAQAGAHRGLFPLLVTGRGLMKPRDLRETIERDGFFGYKVFLNWQGDDYGRVAIRDMIGPAEMRLADELGLVVLLHVPRARRLADPTVQRGVRHLALRHPNARIVLAHCGRCYLPSEMAEGIGAVADLENVYFDTAMVMDPAVIQIILREIDSRRLLFATDLPVAAMRGRRVGVMDHWVDVVGEGYPPSAYRVASDGIRATFMVYEIILAIQLGADLSGIPPSRTRGIFCRNGMALLRHVRNGKAWAAARNRSG